jgi:hypothetical protein
MPSWLSPTESLHQRPDSRWDLCYLGAEGPLSSASPKTVNTLDLVVIEPTRLVDRIMSSWIYCNPRALRKLNWFLGEFAYDPDLPERDEIDQKRLIGLCGVVKVSRIVFEETPFLRFVGPGMENLIKLLSGATEWTVST